MACKGWIVVEAEQDPAKVAPYDASKLVYNTIHDLCTRAGLALDGRVPALQG